jgi:NAD-dependent SIR2 family protein deacetylase
MLSLLAYSFLPDHVQKGIVARCEYDGHAIKPDVVFFGIIPPTKIYQVKTNSVFVQEKIYQVVFINTTEYLPPLSSLSLPPLLASYKFR